MNRNDVIAALDTIGAAGLWAPWRQSNADRDGGIEPATNRAAVIRVWLTACEDQRISGDQLAGAASRWKGERWPTIAELLATLPKTAAAMVEGCTLGRPGSCDQAGMIPVAVHHRDNGGLAVWYGVVYCDCERGLGAAAKCATPEAKGGPERRPGWTVRTWREAWANTGKMLDYLVCPEPWQRLPSDHPRAHPPSADTLAKAEAILATLRAGKPPPPAALEWYNEAEEPPPW